MLAVHRSVEIHHLSESRAVDDPFLGVVVEDRRRRRSVHQVGGPLQHTARTGAGPRADPQRDDAGLVAGLDRFGGGQDVVPGLGLPWDRDAGLGQHRVVVVDRGVVLAGVHRVDLAVDLALVLDHLREGFGNDDQNGALFESLTNESSGSR